MKLISYVRLNDNFDPIVDFSTDKAEALRNQKDTITYLKTLARGNTEDIFKPILRFARRLGLKTYIM